MRRVPSPRAGEFFEVVRHLEAEIPTDRQDHQSPPHVLATEADRAEVDSWIDEESRRLVDRDRQWFKARVGLAARETPREDAFCAHAIAGRAHDLFVVDEALADARFCENRDLRGVGLWESGTGPVVSEGRTNPSYTREQLDRASGVIGPVAA